MQKIMPLLLLGITGLFSVFLSGCEPTPRTVQAANPSPEPCYAVAESAEVMGAVALVNYLWTSQDTVTRETNNTLILKVAFLDGTEPEQALVKKIAPQWSQHANVRFEFVQGGASDIRLGFDRNGGHWSMVGTDALRRQGKKTMNLALRGEQTLLMERVILHEFGHALGLKHEHQSPESSIRWNEQKVIADCKKRLGWDEAKTRHNILDRLNEEQTNFTTFDKESIMLYPIPKQWTNGTFERDWNLTLSKRDKEFIGKQYPFAFRVTGEVTVNGTDDEIGRDEHVHRKYNLEDYFTVDDTDLQFEVPDVRWGGECRVEVQLTPKVVGHGEVKITANAKLFEGTSEYSNDLEDEEEITFNVGWRDIPVERKIRLLNTERFGGDSAEITFIFKVIPSK